MGVPHEKRFPAKGRVPFLTIAQGVRVSATVMP